MALVLLLVHPTFFLLSLPALLIQQQAWQLEEQGFRMRSILTKTVHEHRPLLLLIFMFHPIFHHHQLLLPSFPTLLLFPFPRILLLKEEVALLRAFIWIPFNFNNEGNLEDSLILQQLQDLIHLPVR